MSKKDAEAPKATRLDAKEQNVFQEFSECLVLRHRQAPETFHRQDAHRTFEWMVLMLISEMEAAGWDRIYLSSYRPNKNTRALVDDAFRALYVNFDKRGLIPKLDTVRWALEQASISPEQHDRLAYHLLSKLKAFTEGGKLLADLHSVYRVVPPPKRRSPRHRSELPDPTAPAWARANRQSARKAQITVRVSLDVKELSQDAAAEREVSHSQWLNEAIVRQLHIEGYDAALEKNFRSRQDFETIKRRAQRPTSALPEPKKRAYVSANRADKVISFRVDPELALQIDQAREADEDRSAWFRTAAYYFFSESGEKLVEPPEVRARLSVPVSVTFDPRMLFVLQQQVRDSGLTMSEWLRRVAYWYIRYLRTQSN